MESRPSRMRALALLGAAVGGLAGCGLPSTGAAVRLEEPRAPDAAQEVGRLVGELLVNDAEQSRAAEARLLALSAGQRQALEQHAARIPGERDPRWLHVLEEQGLLPALSPGERTALWLWKVRRPEPSFAMKAQAALAGQARSDPAPLLLELARGGAAVAPVAAALTVAGRRDAVPALVARYLAAPDDDERRPLTEALAALVGEEARPRLGGTPEERRRDADETLRRWRALEGGARG